MRQATRVTTTQRVTVRMLRLSFSIQNPHVLTFASQHTETSSGFNMKKKISFKIPPFYFFPASVNITHAFAEGDCGTVLILPEALESVFTLRVPPFSVVALLQFHEAFYWGTCALHSICTEIVIFYCIYLKTKQGALRFKKKRRQEPPNIPVKMWYISFVFISCG